jgi:hypothetical protein
VNEIWDEGITALSEALKSNTTLVTLELGGKDFVALFHSH